MPKRIAFAGALILVGILVFASVAGGNSLAGDVKLLQYFSNGEPTSDLYEFFAACSEGDLAQADSYLASAYFDDPVREFKGIKTSNFAAYVKDHDISIARVETERIVGDTAIIGFSINKDDLILDYQTATLVLEGNKWKVLPLNYETFGLPGILHRYDIWTGHPEF